MPATRRDWDPPALVIDRRTPSPLYHQLHLALREAIAGGHYPEASILPSEPALARQLRICRPTVHAAMLALHHDGIIERVQIHTGSGLSTLAWQVMTRLPVPAGKSADHPERGATIAETNQPESVTR